MSTPFTLFLYFLCCDKLNGIGLVRSGEKMQNYKKEMGKRIKEKRTELRLTQENLSETLGISVKHFSEVERGIAGLSIENLIHLSTIFDVSLDYLIKGENTDHQWQSTLLLLQSVPEEKIPKMKDLIRNGIDLIK